MSISEGSAPIWQGSIQGACLANSIIGNIGSDKLAGLDGSDTMTGGLGDDVCLFSTALSPANVDTIASAFKLIGPGGATVDIDDRILYTHSTGQLFYDADGSAPGTAVLFAILSNMAVIDQTDFCVI